MSPFNALDDLLQKRPRRKALGKGESATHPDVLRREHAAIQSWLKEAEAAIAPYNQGGGPGGAYGAMTTSYKGMADNYLLDALLYAKEHEWGSCRNNCLQAIVYYELARVKPSALAHGLLALTIFMVEGNTPALRSYLEEVIAHRVDTAGLRSMLAKYYLMVGDYPSARRLVASPKIRKHRRVVPIFKAVEGQSWDRYPCNYYTYRHSLISNETIELRKLELRKMTPEEKRDLAKSEAVADSMIERIIYTLECHRLWNTANEAFAKQNYVQATKYYRDAADKISGYFQTYYATDDPAKLLHYNQKWERDGQEYTSNKWLITYIRDRNRALSLQELYHLDWVRPHRCPEGWDAYGSNLDMLRTIFAWQGKWIEKVDCPLALMLYNFIPMAIAECGLARRRFEESDEVPGLGVKNGALSSINQALAFHDKHRIMSEFVELPFATMLKARILLLKADFQYKSGEKDPSPAKDPSTGEVRYQGLKAGKTYQGVIDTFYAAGYGEYMRNIRTAGEKIKTAVAELQSEILDANVAKLARQINHPTLIPGSDIGEKQQVLQQLGHDPKIPGLVSANSQLPGAGQRRAPFDRLIRFELDGVLPKESNPLIYAIIVEAYARLNQLDAGLNWLGYCDDYVSPWRFQYLLERARYFVAHASQVQSLYLNFLNNAEKEEAQEKTAGQNVVMELANVDLETSRLKEANLQFAAAQASTQMAKLVSWNAQDRYANYLKFDDEMDRLTGQYMDHVLSSSISNVITGSLQGMQSGFSMSASWQGAVVGALMGAAIGGWQGYDQHQMQKISLEMQNQQRELEKKNLFLAQREAAEALKVSQAQEAAMAASVNVAVFQRVVAMMRHDYALQTLEFLKNRTLTSELWYRLTNAIRGVADSYLKYGVELAFLAEQAFEFETNQRMNVIRFDYDMQATGDFLAGDFLLRDLDSLEKGFITGASQRRRLVRYTVSLSRDFPDALQQIREKGWCVLNLTLLPLEQRFPGLYNMRVSSVDIHPFTLMDPSRFVVNLTNLGSSSIRVRADHTAPDDPFNKNDYSSWTATRDATLDREWPVKVRVAAPETEIYTGVTRQNDTAGDSFFSNHQLNAFEGVGAATAWRIDMSMRENRVDPPTLADIVLVFHINGYFSDELQSRLLNCMPDSSVQTMLLSGRQFFPDGYYQFQNQGVMTWSVDQAFIPTGYRAGRLRNLGFSLLPAGNGPQFGRLLASQRLRVRYDSQTQALTVLTLIPTLSFEVSGLKLKADVVFNQSVTMVMWNFGDDSGWQSGDTDGSRYSKEHIYPRGGVYLVTLRVVTSGKMEEIAAKVALAADADLLPPLTPDLTLTAVSLGQAQPDQFRLMVDGGLAAGSPVGIYLYAGNQKAGGTNLGSIHLPKDREVELLCVVIRDLVVNLSGYQCFDPAAELTVHGLRAATNRTFNDQGILQPGAHNPLGQRIFGNGEHSPVDQWQMTIMAEKNPFLKAVDSTGREIIDLSEIADAVLSLEYDAEAKQ